MGKIVSQTFVSLDGVTQALVAQGEDTRDGFTLGGWVVPFAGADFGISAVATYQRARALLVSRRAYEQFAYWWPQRRWRAIARIRPARGSAQSALTGGRSRPSLYRHLAMAD